MDCASNIDLSQQTRANILLTASGARRAARATVSRKNLGEMQKLAQKLGLTMLVSFESQSSTTAAYREWTAFSRDPYSPSATTFAYFGRDRQHSEALRYADEDVDHEATGQLFGYPDCCVRGFSEAAKGARSSYDPTFKSYSHGSTGSWHLNVSLFKFGLALLQHVPCSTQCERSATMASETVNVLWNEMPSFVGACAASLGGLFLHGRAGRVGSARLAGPTGDFIISSIGRSDDDVLATLLRPGTPVKVRPDGTKLGHVLLPASDYKAFVFT
jgi:hypothetical protein